METRDDHVNGQNEASSAERRPQSIKDPDTLKRVHLNPFNSLYKENVLLNSSSNSTRASGSQITQNGCQKSLNPLLHPVQTTVSRFSSTTTNPFLTQGKDSSGSSVSSNTNKDLTLGHGQSNGWAHFPTSSTPSLENGWAVFPSPTLSQETNQTTFPSQKWEIFQDSYTDRICSTGLSSQKTNIFQPFKEDTSFSQKTVANEKSPYERDYLLEYILANQKNDDKPIPSTTVIKQLDISEDLFSFLSSPAINKDILTNTAASQSNEIFKTPESSVQSRVFQTMQLFQAKASVQNDNSHSSDDSAGNNGQFKPQDLNIDKMFVPSETSTLPAPLNASTNGGLMFRRRPPKPAPRSKAPKNPKQSINHDIFSTPAVSVPADRKPAQTLFTPTPATPSSIPAVSVPADRKPAQTLFTPTPATPSSIPAVSVPADRKPAQTLFTPTLATPSSIPAVPQATTKIQDTMQSQVYEDILFIGQEKCVEDWPEDSPELSPDWKPSGKFKLRRESMTVALESEATLNEDSLGKKSAKTKIKLIKRVSRRGSKDKAGLDQRVLQTGTVRRESEEIYPDSLNGAYGDTIPWEKKLHASDDVSLPEQEYKNAKMKSKSVKSKKPKFVVPQLQYHGTKKKSLGEVFENGSPFLQASKNELIYQDSYEDWLRNSEQKEPVMKDFRPKEPLTYKPSPSQRLSKDAIEDDLKKMNGLSFLEESKENMSIKAENENRRFSADLLTEYQPELFSPKSPDSSGKIQELQDCRPKRSIKFAFPHLSRKESKSTLENDSPHKGADLFKASHIKGLEINEFEDYSEMRKSPVQRISPIIQRDSKGLNDTEKGEDLFKTGDAADDDWMDKLTGDSKTEKMKKACLPSSESKAEDQVCFSEDIELPGATSGDYYLSEAAKAEWLSSQMDIRRARAPDLEPEGVNEEEEGDTDSLMEWWNTVELWDELPSDKEISLKEDETKSFTEIADKVHRGLRVFYKVFTEQAEVLYQNVLLLYAIGEDLSNFHRRAKIANITGGTTTAVGGVTAITGLALAPFTLGVSMIVSAVGLGIATAGGIAAASASISDNVHDMNDRKKIEVVVQDYETRLAELRRCLCFVAEGVHRLRFHPLLRRNNYYAGDWEVRRALQTISLVGDPIEHAEDIVEKSMTALNSVCKGMDGYFSKDSKELKKGCKKEVTMQVNMLAKLLHEGLVALNAIREQLMEATGQV